MRPPIDLHKALQIFRTELEREAYSASYSAQDRNRKLRIVSMIDMKLAGRLGGFEVWPEDDIQAGIEAPSDGWR